MGEEGAERDWLSTSLESVWDSVSGILGRRLGGTGGGEEVELAGLMPEGLFDVQPSLS